MAKLYILCGYPFAGKSTIASQIVQELGFVRIAIDEINTERGVGVRLSTPIAPDDWRMSYDIYHDRIAQNLKAGKSVIADSVAYKKQDRDELRKLAEDNDAEVIVLFVNTPLAVVKERWLDNRRTQQRADVRDDDFNQVIDNYEEPSADENVVVIYLETGEQQHNN